MKKLRDKVDELKLGKLLTHKNIRNGKHKEIKDWCVSVNV